MTQTSSLTFVIMFTIFITCLFKKGLGTALDIGQLFGE